MANSNLHALSELGQSVWLDYVARDMLRNGELERMMRDDAVTGVTSNPTIFQKAIAAGNAYDEQLRDLLEHETDPKEIFVQLAVRDIRDACDLLRRHWDEGCRGCDGYVSIEVDPTLALDTQATIDQAVRFHDAIDRPNLFVKIPGTKEGLPAIEEMIARGRSINITLLFSLERYAEAAMAYFRGVERLVESGGDPTEVASVASFFVSRVDTEADKRLDEAGRPELKGKLAIANAKLAYQAFEEIFSGEDWEFLESKGATKQRPLWASTSTKNPEYGDVVYVEELAGPETVNTMPTDTLEAFMDHGEVRSPGSGRSPIKEGLDEARALLMRLGEAGVDYEDVTEVLEKEGVQKFADSFDELLEGIKDKGRQVVRQP